MEFDVRFKGKVVRAYVAGKEGYKLGACIHADCGRNAPHDRNGDLSADGGQSGAERSRDGRLTGAAVLVIR
jgi:hypothetical protein